MRWPWSWRRRRSAAVVAADFSTFRPGSWADVAYPPVDNSAVRVVRHATGVGTVRLGFIDGTSVEVEEASVESAALRAAARKLLSD